MTDPTNFRRERIGDIARGVMVGWNTLARKHRNSGLSAVPAEAISAFGLMA